jgi:hypothetical protein
MRSSASRTAVKPAVAVFTAVVLALATTPSAFASDREGTEAPEAVAASLEGLQSVAPSLLLPAAATADGGRVDEPIHVGPGAVLVPLDPSAGVELAGWSRESVIVGLPFANEAEDAVKLRNGAVAFTGVNSSSSVIVSEAGVQLVTTIADETAPTRYSYDVSLTHGQSLTLANGGAQVANADGSIAFVVGSAWAKDADGAAVATHYEVDGNRLTQVVSHAGTSAAYPIVADPIFIAPWVFRCLLGLGLNGPQIVAAFASGTIWGGLGRAALACAVGR